MAKITIIFDRIIRPDTTGIHCEEALKRAGHEVTYFAPLKLDGKNLLFSDYEGLPENQDLYLQIDDDISYPGPNKVKRPKVYWCIDTHRMNELVGGGTRVQKMAGFDQIFMAQKDAAMKYNCQWLPLAFNEKVNYKIQGIDKKFDWSFIGNLIGKRKELLEPLIREFTNCFIGNAYGDEMNRIYNESLLIVNISISNDINMRLFEAPATGTPVITNRLNNGEEELFDSLLIYENLKELKEKIRFYLSNQNLLCEIAEKQYQRVINHHTYFVRMKELLYFCGIGK